MAVFLIPVTNDFLRLHQAGANRLGPVMEVGDRKIKYLSKTCCPTWKRVPTATIAPTFLVAMVTGRPEAMPSPQKSWNLGWVRRSSPASDYGRTIGRGRDVLRSHAFLLLLTPDRVSSWTHR